MSAKRVCDMTCGAMHEFALSLDKAGCDANLVQKVVGSKGNRLAKIIHTALINAVYPNDKFELITTFEVVVPQNYDHSTCLTRFNERLGNKFICYDEDITDENFSKVTIKLVPGRRFKVKAFRGLRENVSTEDCLAHLRKEGAVFVGAQGVTLAYSQRKNKLLSGLRLVSFDEEETLPENHNGYRFMAYIRFHGDCETELNSHFVDESWGNDVCLLCFIEDVL